MSYLVLARKYRPADFTSVSGQEHVTRTLGNAIERGKVGHAYLFAGPRGVGKTSIARIFSKALNCKEGPTRNPCLKCTNCQEISAGNSLAVREIDGASHNSVDDVRDLIESFRSLPPAGYKYKIYIIDEVHMLSTAAFNALLKSLEEPPPHTVFILATTEVHKIPETVISRCQRYEFKALGVETIEKRLKEIVDKEKVSAESESLRIIARLAEGSMRDAQSLLERVQTFCEKKITVEETAAALGVVQRRILFDLSARILTRDTSSALDTLSNLFGSGQDPIMFMREMVNHFRELFTAKFAGEAGLNLLGVGPDDRVELLRQVAALSNQDIQDLYDMLRSGIDLSLRSHFSQFGLEALVVRMCTRQPVEDIAALVARAGSGSDSGGNTVSKAPQRPAVEPAAKVHVSPAPKEEEKPVRSAVTVAPQNSSAAVQKEDLDWGDFIKFLSSKGGMKILVEHLKRLQVVAFNEDRLEASAPEFTVNSIKPEHQKIKGLMAEYCTEIGRNTANPALIIKAGEVKKNTPSANADPAAAGGNSILENLQKVFPGSKLDRAPV